MILTCPYCGTEAKLASSAIIYRGKSYGMAWICGNFPLCDSYVGCHKGTQKPLGRMANAELRAAKKRAHAAFDPIWRQALPGKMTRNQIRQNTYAWLARQLKIRFFECHIGMMDVETCQRVVEVCATKKQGEPK